MFKKADYQLFCGDCRQVMDKLIAENIKVNAIITDPPYGTTACKWDSIIPFDKMWECCNKLIKNNGAIVLFGSEPFASKLRISNLEMYKYDWIWNKNNSSSALNCNYQPLKIHENVLIFSKSASTFSKNGNMCYYPQGLQPKHKIVQRKEIKNGIFHKYNTKETIQKFTNYPKSILNFSKESKSYHPTQKPLALMEYLVKTYTNEGDTVLDFTMGSGTTGVACKNLNRNFIGIELDENYYNIAKERIEK